MYACRGCGKLATVCCRCDRGHVYCGPACSAAARRVSVAECRRRYRMSERGREAAYHRQKKRRGLAKVVVTVATEFVDASKTARERALRASAVVESRGPREGGSGPPRNGPEVGAGEALGNGSRAPGDVKVLVTRCTQCGRRTSGFVRSEFRPPRGPRPRTPWLDHIPATPSRASSLRSAQSAPGPSLGMRCAAKTGRDSVASPQGPGHTLRSEISQLDVPPERSRP